MKELQFIQQHLVAPKDLTNKFGGFKYRSCEKILEAVKKHLNEQKCTITITDDVVECAGRVFIQAKATITNEAGEHVTTSAFAELPIEKKGMDQSQLTGSASSYARKYALCGLLAIDDNKDADDIAEGPGTQEIEAIRPDGEEERKYIANQIASIAEAIKKIDNLPALNEYYRAQSDYYKKNEEVISHFSKRKLELTNTIKTTKK